MGRRQTYEVVDIRLTPEQERRIGVFRRFLRRSASGQAKAAVRRGDLPDPATLRCADCGAPAIGYDHRDYRHGDQVEPVCRKCNWRRGPARPIAPSRNLHVWTVARFLAEDVGWLLSAVERAPEIADEAETISGAARSRLDIIKAMVRSNANQTAIATRLGISRERVRQLIERFDLGADVREARRRRVAAKEDDLAQESLRQCFAQRPDLWPAFALLADQGYAITFSRRSSLLFYLNGTPLRVTVRNTHSLPKDCNYGYHHFNIAKPGSYYLVLTPCGWSLYPPSPSGTANAPCWCRERPANYVLKQRVGKYIEPLLVWNRNGFVPIIRGGDEEPAGHRRPRARKGRSWPAYTLEIEPELYAEARRVARESGQTLADLVRSKLREAVIAAKRDAA